MSIDNSKGRVQIMTKTQSPFKKIVNALYFKLNQPHTIKYLSVIGGTVS